MIISVTSLKGGVGKSTIAQNLAVCLAHNGVNVCVADADPDNENSGNWGNIRSDDSTFQFGQRQN
jgi:chromosome partitioning protein